MLSGAPDGRRRMKACREIEILFGELAIFAACQPHVLG